LQWLINRRDEEWRKRIREQCDNELLATQQVWAIDYPNFDVQSLSEDIGETTGSEEK
jgi:hypothetical protein